MFKLSLFLSAGKGPILKSPKRTTKSSMRFLKLFTRLGVLRDLKSPNLLSALHLLQYPGGSLSLKIPRLPRKTQMRRCDDIDNRFSPFSRLTPRYGPDESHVPHTLTIL
jgi:hypothetical protein